MVKYFLFFFLLVSNWCMAQQVISLYPEGIPNSRNVPDEEENRPNELVDSLASKVSKPTLTVFLPAKDKANGTSVIICPGGGYQSLLTKREGSDIARAFNRLGVAAFVLKYRLPSDHTMIDKTIGPLQDAQQAIKLVRESKADWGIDASKIGIMGFSAGGHLAASAGTWFDDPVIENGEGTSLRPDFMILIYPVISLTDSIGHLGSRGFLLGESPDKETIRQFSNEFRVNRETPPAFITHADDDTVVPVANSVVFYEALRKNGVSAGLHIYAKGEHGFLKTPTFEEWFGRCTHWMRESGWIQ